jgi:prolipoprotein diacylglyceryltransferase
LLLERRLLKRGATFGVLLVLYGVSRFTVDFFRYYEENARVLLGLTFNQVISVALVVLGAYLLARRTEARNRIVSQTST